MHEGSPFIEVPRLRPTEIAQTVVWDRLRARLEGLTTASSANDPTDLAASRSARCSKTTLALHLLVDQGRLSAYWSLVQLLLFQ
jgi:hypothetical protein